MYLGNTYSGLQFLATTVRQSEHQQVVPLHGWQAFSDDQIIELKALIWNNTKEKRRSESIRQLSAKVKLDPSSTKEEQDLFASIFETKAPCNNTLEVESYDIFSYLSSIFLPLPLVVIFLFHFRFLNSSIAQLGMQ